VFNMLILLVVLCPPLAVLVAAGPTEALKNCGLSLLFYFPGVFHARSVVDRYRVNRRYDALMLLLEARDPALAKGKSPTPRAA
jgi:uncharacterized membrane protein YqaE (UPF0057 family)